MAEMTAGQVLAGRYRIVSLLGAGGVSTVWLAEDTVLNTRWALKRFSTSHLLDEDKKPVIAQFRKEVEILSRLSHPLLPKVADSFSESGDHYVVLEYCEGETLSEVMKKTAEALPEERVVRWALQICDVLEYLHAQKPPVIYRDLKPQNLILTTEDTVRFIDFGIARFFNPVKDRDTLFMGTPGYAPPEQFGHGQTDPRSDIYSLGATLSFLLTGQDPGQNPFHFEPLSKYNRNISPLLESVVARAVEIEPHNRFSSVSQIRQVLRGEKKLEELPGAAWILVEPPELSFENVTYGSRLTRTMRVVNAGGGNLKLRIRPGAPWISSEREHYYGNDVQIPLTIKASEIQRNEAPGSMVEVITDTMKITVPVSITFLPSLHKRLPDWMAGLLLFTIPLLTGTVWYGIVHLKSLTRSLTIFHMDIFSLLFILALSAMIFLYRGKQRNFIAIVIALGVAFCCGEGKYLTLFLFMAYCLWSARTVIKFYNGLNTDQQKDLHTLYALSLGIPSLIYFTSLYGETFTLHFSLLVHTVVALLINMFTDYYSIDRWRPSLTRKITSSRWSGIQSGIEIFKSTFWLRKGKPGTIHYVTAVTGGIIWGSLSLLNFYALHGNLFLIPESLTPLFSFEYWTLGLPYALSRLVPAGAPLSYLAAIMAGIMGGLLIMIALFYGDRTLRRVSASVTGDAPLLFRIFLVMLTLNLLILGAVLQSIASQHRMYYSPMESWKEAEWQTIASGSGYAPALRLYALDRLSALSFGKQNYVKTLMYCNETGQLNSSLPHPDPGITSQTLYLKSVCQFYSGSSREALINFDAMRSVCGDPRENDSRMRKRFRSTSDFGKNQESFFLDRTASGSFSLGSDLEITLSTYYYHALCNEAIFNYRNMARTLSEVMIFYEQEPLRAKKEYDSRRSEISKRLELLSRFGLEHFRTGEIFYQPEQREKAGAMHGALAEWLKESGRPDLAAMEKALQQRCMETDRSSRRLHAPLSEMRAVPVGPELLKQCHNHGRGYLVIPVRNDDVSLFF